MYKNKIKKILLLVVVFILCVPYIQALTPVKDTNNPNIYRVVGLGYYDIWKHADGTWQGGVGKGAKITTIWEQSFPMPRNIKKVTVRDVVMTSGDDEKIWDDTRTPTDAFEIRKPQTCTSKIVQDYKVTGEGTRTVTVTANLTATLTAYVAPDELPKNNLAPGVEGLRYYIPLMIEFELYPDVKTVTVQHFNANTGQRLAENDVKQVAPNTSYTTSAKSFSPAQFLNVKISYDNGVSWAETLTLDGSQSTLTINKYKFCIPIKD